MKKVSHLPQLKFIASTVMMGFYIKSAMAAILDM